MPRKTKQRSMEEVLASPVNPTGQGEDPAVRDLLSSKFVEGSNAEALNIALAIQQIVKGQNSLLENQDRFADDLRRIHQRMDEMDKTADRWNTDREAFVQEVLDRADTLKANGLEKDRIVAKGGIEFQHAVEAARAEQVSQNAAFEMDLARMPKVTVVSPGELVMLTEGGRSVARIMNETVKIKHKKWVLPVGKAVEVPKVVADVLNERRKLQEETAARERVLSANVDNATLEKEWRAINNRYNSTTDTLPTA